MASNEVECIPISALILICPRAFLKETKAFYHRDDNLRQSSMQQSEQAVTKAINHPPRDG
jgi:hypothetical protein